MPKPNKYGSGYDPANGGKAKGITLADVIRSVSDLFDENKALDHSFALEDFKQTFLEEMRSTLEKKAQQHKHPGKGLN